MFLISPQFDLSQSLAILSKHGYFWFQSVLLHFFKNTNMARGPMTYAWSMVIYLLLLTDSGLTDTKANLLFVQVFIPLSHWPWCWSEVNWLKFQSFYRNWKDFCVAVSFWEVNKSRRSVKWEHCCCSWIQPLGLCDVWCAQMFPPQINKCSLISHTEEAAPNIMLCLELKNKAKKKKKPKTPITLSRNLLVCSIHSSVLLHVPQPHSFTCWHAFKDFSSPLNGCVQAQHRL